MDGVVSAFAPQPRPPTRGSWVLVWPCHKVFSSASSPGAVSTRPCPTCLPQRDFVYFCTKCRRDVVLCGEKDMERWDRKAVVLLTFLTVL